ncbi:putative TIM-barrel fold metal-dependent hydrolase [Nocardioides zeae]|uniref:TIM-barrel fold metal-dependent hydrolase n=1 Tax=Nocardioides zeae TaxID=1457234 RepID=A0ACC6II38_9ACTN|nr:amidohydrolase family protein [Nocardioides zeae]MDR6176210.1 putative TIM-barrel fold metal-dependent hydrolase [Nocardioides zeae]MDR6210356.1 putative TIM-barrel fold metal-dependent hydrolase [Nocardioides zeae]
MTAPTDRPPVVDMCALLHDTDGWRLYLDRFRVHAPEYLSVFGRAMCRYFGADHGTYAAALAHDWDAALDVLLPPDRPELDLAAHVADRRARGVVREVVLGGPGRRPDGRSDNNWLLEVTRANPDHFTVWAGVALQPGADAEVARLAADGAEGLCVIPFLDGTTATDPAHDAFWATAAAAGLPVWLHTGHHVAASQPSGLGSWVVVEELARRHPSLWLVAGHAGWPDVTHMLLTAARHPRVRLELSSHRARTMTTPGSGWEAALQHDGALARGRMMFGTSGWVNPVAVDLLAAEVAALPLTPGTAAAWLGSTALDLLDAVAQRPS